MASNRLLYACESGSIAFAPIPGRLVTDRGPKWHHALEPKVRNPEMGNFDSARKFGVEVFKDENTGGSDLHRRRDGVDRGRACSGGRAGSEEAFPPGSDDMGWFCAFAPRTSRTSPTRPSRSASRCSRTRTPTCSFT